MDYSKIRKLFLFTVLSALIFLSTIEIAYAQNLEYKIPSPTEYESLEDIISAAGSLLRPLFLVTFGAMVLVGAFLMLTSQGNEEKVENSKKTIIAAIIGFAIAALAPTFVNIVTSFLGIEGF
jgi:hypothetical protein